MEFSGDRALVRRAWDKFGEEFDGKTRAAEQRQAQKVREYLGTSEYYVTSHFRAIAWLAVIVTVSAVTVLWFSACLRKEMRRQHDALRLSEKYTSEDLLNEDVRRAVEDALNVRNEDLLFNALCRMVTDGWIPRMLGAYEGSFRAAWQDAMRQHVFVGFLCVLVAGSLVGALVALCYITCNAQMWCGRRQRRRDVAKTE